MPRLMQVSCNNSHQRDRSLPHRTREHRRHPAWKGFSTLLASREVRSSPLLCAHQALKGCGYGGQAEEGKGQATEGVLGPGDVQQLLHASRIHPELCKPASAPITVNTTSLHQKGSNQCAAGLLLV